MNSVGLPVQGGPFPFHSGAPDRKLGVARAPELSRLVIEEIKACPTYFRSIMKPFV